MWRIRDVYPGSDFFPSRIPDPKCLHPGSRILKEFKYFNPKKAKKWLFLSSKKYVPGCSSRIPDQDADFLPSRIQGSKRQPIPDPGSGSATLGSTFQNPARFMTLNRVLSLRVGTKESMRLVFIITNNPNLVPIDFAVQQLAGGVPHPGGQAGRLGLHKRQLAAHSLRPLLYGGQAQASRLLQNNVNQKMREQKSETRKKSTIFHIINP